MAYSRASIMFREIAQYTAALLGRSTYQAPASTPGSLDLDDPQVLRAREQHGGQIQRQPISQTRWYMAQLEAAEYMADLGKIELAARLMRAAKTDGVFGGVLSTRTGGLVRLPKRFRGDADVIAALEIGHAVDGEVRSVFEEMFPSQELALLAADGCTLGVGVAQLVEVEGRDYPVMVRLEPQFLSYDWNTNVWSYTSIAGELQIVPGDGRWILHTPGGRTAPWANGIWRSIGRAFIRKEHAAEYLDSWQGKLAHPARVAVAPSGGTEEQAEAWFRSVLAWGVNTVFGMRPGYDVKLIESNGRGWESFLKAIDTQNNEMIIAVAGQLISTTGGSGFQNNDIHAAIRSDLIRETAAGLEYTINTQGIPAFVAARFGEAAIESKQCIVSWDVEPPKDRNADAASLTATASAISTLTDSLKVHSLTPDVAALCLRFTVPLVEDDVIDEALTTTTTTTTSDDTTEITETETTEIDDTTTEDGEHPAQDTALNGAQVESLLTIVGQVAAGQLPRESAIEIIVAAFGLSYEQADRMLGTVGAGFVPASTSVDVEPVEPEPEEEQVAA